ncbi:hypothetical protein B9Z19DRAFT_1070707 [Tuber borchii]|uniref:Uncharacterized protein n=1 Tax=Tuber borchii TaxID=42251 RepID=A0A2T7A8W4_TUBBO|nr:hypothetical protein B9Z19DRAFT_1070707 [Tuber borchii]
MNLSKSGPELKYVRFSIANNAQRKMPSDFARRASIALSFRSISHPHAFTLRLIKHSTSSFIKLFMSRLILVHSEGLQGRLFEICGTSRLERNILTVRISISPKILPVNSLHKLSFSPSMPSMRMYTGSVRQSLIAFRRTFHKEHRLVKNLSPCFSSSALQPSKRFPSCWRVLYSRSLATLASLSCDNSASSEDVLAVGSSGETKWKIKLTPSGGVSGPLRNSAATRLANILFPVPGPPQSQSSFDSLLSCHPLYTASSKIHFPVSPPGRLYSSRRWSKSISGGDTPQPVHFISSSKVATQILSHKFKTRIGNAVFSTGQSVRPGPGRGRTTFRRPVPSFCQLARQVRM